MTLHFLAATPDWDAPIFKKLASNDTGSAAGHQGGVVIPIALRPFFPGLLGVTTPAHPTIEHRIEAQLFVENSYRGTVSTRYQFQTWGDQRNPESRLTGHLGPLRNLAVGGDILVIQRSIDRLDHYRLTLVRRTSGEFAAVDGLLAGRRWGVLATSTRPVSDDDLNAAISAEQALEAAPFQLIDTAAATVTSTVRGVARSLAFRVRVIGLYDETCAICSESLRTPLGQLELDAAHIVPRSMMGADDARNGFALCKRHHWAFDKGLFGVSDQRTVLVPPSVSAIAPNASLMAFHDMPIREANEATLRVDQSAFEWHRENILVRQAE